MGAPRSTVARAEVNEELDYRHVVEVFPDAVIAARGEIIVYLNAAAETLLGWSRDELIGRELSVIVPERLREAHRRGFERYRTTGVPHLIGRPVRVPALHREGREIDIELTIGVFTIDGERQFVASLRDLKDRVELERQLAISQRLRGVTTAATQLIAHDDADVLATIVANTLVDGLDAALARVWLTTSDRSTLVLRASAGLSTATKDSSRAQIEVATCPFKIGRVARSLEPIVESNLSGDDELDQAWLAREGLVSVAIFPLRNGEELRGVLAAFFRAPLAPETSDLLHTFAALASAAVNDARLVEQLRGAIDARDRFLSMASHELNTPLTTLRLQLESITRNATNLPAIAERVQRSQKQVSRLAGLVRELLDVTRITGGHLGLRREQFDLAELVGDVLDRHAFARESTGSQLDVRLQPGVVGCWDRDRIDQVVSNLVSNAIKYGDGKSIAIEVSQRGERARIVVCDQGVGIAADDRARIFGRFERASRSPSEAGLGIGLFVSHEIVTAHGGTLTVESDLGRGSTFVVELPVA